MPKYWGFLCFAYAITVSEYTFIESVDAKRWLENAGIVPRKRVNGAVLEAQKCVFRGQLTTYQDQMTRYRSVYYQMTQMRSAQITRIWSGLSSDNAVSV